MLDLFKYTNKVYKIIGAALTVHSELNWGLLEAVYQEALHLELLDCGIDNQREQEITVYYKNHVLDKKYKMDIVVDDIIVELKSVTSLAPAHRAQLCNYLRLTHKPLGLLISHFSYLCPQNKSSIMIVTNQATDTKRNFNATSTRNRIMASTMSVDEYFDELIDKVREDYANDPNMINTTKHIWPITVTTDRYRGGFCEV